MKLTSIGKSSSNEYNNFSVKTKAKQDFIDSLQKARENHDELQIKDMLDKIKISGDKLKVSKSITNIVEYKKQIKKYLSFVTQNYYAVRKDRKYYGDILLRVEVINKEVDELTRALLEKEKENFSLANRVDKITGLLVDLFC